MSILLAQIDDEGGKLSITEFENMFWLFAVAGNETLRNAIPGGMLALLQHPAAWRELQAAPDLVPGAVEEMLRWWTPVMNFRRTAAEDAGLGGVDIRAGDKVLLSFLSANHDERVFSDPAVFDIRRDPNPHLSFGQGPTSASAPGWRWRRCARCLPSSGAGSIASSRQEARLFCAPTSSAG